MFAFRVSLDPGSPQGARVEVAFTDASLDLQSPKHGFADALAGVVELAGVPFARLNQIHGDEVVTVVDEPLDGDEVPDGDALVTARAGTGLMIRVADCVPVLLADPEAGVIGAAHAGRRGVELDIVSRAVERMHALGARSVRAWIGPHVCGRCYEVPAAMRDEVAATVPAAYAETSWGTPALDLGAGVEEQLAAAGVPSERVPGCTLEDDRFHSYRRDGAAAGRIAGLVWLR